MKNRYMTAGDVVLVDGKLKDRVVQFVIDRHNLEKVASFKNTWHVRYDEKADLYYVYGQTWVGRKATNIRLHRFITNASDDKVVDHKNGNGLDNREENLRVVTQLENCHNQRISRNNTSGYPGVNWYKAYGKWRARVMFNYKEYTLGYFDEKEDAIAAVIDFKKERGLLV